MAIAKAYDWERRLYVLVVRDEAGKITAICPFALHNKRLTWLTAPRADYNDIVCSREAGVDAVKACLEHLRATSGTVWDEACLEDVPDRSVWNHCANRLPSDLRIFKNNPESCWSLQFDPAGQVLKEITQKKGYQRNEKALAKKGKVTFKSWETADERMENLPWLFKLHQTRWEADQQASMFADESSREFYRVLVNDASLAELIDFVSLKVGEDLVAHHFGFWGKARFMVYKWCYDPGLQKEGPGTILMVRLMERVAGAGCAEFDFLRGGEGYKKRFANAYYVSHDWVAFASPVRHHLNRAKSWLRENFPPLASSLAALSRGEIKVALRSWNLTAEEEAV